ncbi:hypothetical protein AB840_11835 [Megasphaera cerevisiae DSM 20462]|uniref:Uncharacterized protein n=1 Tax=Megasphaera cerevisiae DSM 20462 TaxID=1122219 RepID=A0A0J6WU99_9FIRM|nr:hypothetical protein [Megasphaera cerevisiae]KMO85758.1 hypothetical protein AB840_11835 [Megasphaera cerevisiae DSM 20462]SKA16795.1 hypothetical protein SAMN05660900_02696 [Megasphaera cerevisiae DSM 20462]
MLNTIAVLRKTTCGLAMIPMIFMSSMQISATGTYTGQSAAVIAQNGEMSGHDMQNGEMSGHDMQNGEMSGHDMQNGEMSGHDMQNGEMSGHDMQNGEMSGHTMQNGEMSGHDMEEGGNAAEQTATREDSRVILSVFGGLAILVILVAGIMKYTRISKMRR